MKRDDARVQVAQSDDVAIELLDDDDDEEEYEEGDQPYIFDEHGNPIQAEYVAVDGEEYQEGEGAEGESPQDTTGCLLAEAL